MRTLNSEQKPNWPAYLPSLVYAYNATPHSSTGFQPYELMFGCKAPMPCANWLRLGNYKPESFKSKTIWLNQQLNAMLHANKQAVKLIEKSTKHNKDCTGGKELTIQLEIMCYCVIIWKATTKYRISTNQTCMSWLVTTRSLMFTIFSFWIRITKVLLKWSTGINYSILTIPVHLLWLITPKMMMILQ